MWDASGKDIPPQGKMVRRMRRKVPVRCGAGEKAEDIFQARALPIAIQPARLFFRQNAG